MNIAVPIYPGSKTPTQGLNVAYLRYLKKAGYNPITLNAFSNDESQMHDGLLIPGGVDISPLPYGADNLYSSYCQPARDDFERKLIKLYVEAGLPIFGICRGFQLLFLESQRILGRFPGVRFTQDLDGHTSNIALEVGRNIPVHKVWRKEELYEDKGQLTDVNSMHHQGVISGTIEREGEKKDIEIEELLSIESHLKVLAWTHQTAEEFIVEAFDIPEWNVRAVQWHPEELNDYKLLHTFFGKPNK